MPDFEAPVIEAAESAAESAVRYILKRVTADPNFRHYMLGTQTLEMCVTAEACRLVETRRGNPATAKAIVEKSLEDSIARADARLKRSGETTPDVTLLRRRIEAAQEKLNAVFLQGCPWTDELQALSEALQS